MPSGICTLSPDQTFIFMNLQAHSTSHRYQTAAAAPYKSGRLASCRGTRQQSLYCSSTFNPAKRSKLCEQAALRNDERQYVRVAETSSLLWLLSQLPASAADSSVDFSKGSFSTQSYIVTLGLFLISLPGLWSQIKRAPKASIKRKTFEMEGPAKAGAEALDIRAKQIFLYFKKYNYEVKQTGETITFSGTYAASRGQAAALVFYVFCGLLSTALVLSIALPFGGQNWYWLAALSPLSGAYYWQRGTREEEFRVKMVTADDEQTTDILVEGDKEEIERMTRELQLWEKGKVYVKGLLEK